MGEARRKILSHRQLLRDCPECVFCGGVAAATTIEHIPPIAMFDKRIRPRGLEFAACKPCNEGTRDADQIASLIGRAVPNSQAQPDSNDWDKLIQGINNNIPGALEELAGNQLSISAARAQADIGDGSGVIHVNGPIISRHMLAFAVKLALALHYEVTGELVPVNGGVSVRWFTNYQRLKGEFPHEIEDILGPPQTLTQGKREVSDQFQYAWASANDAIATATMATFRFAFAVVCFTAAERSTLHVEGVNNDIYSPGSQLRLLGIH